MSGFDYGKYYQGILPLADALREGEERCWSDGTERGKTEREYVFYLGCNVLRTVNLAETIVAILNAMGIDFVTLGGPANCCGVIHYGNGDMEISRRLTRQTLDKFTAYKPRAVLTYCPSCHFHMDRTIPEYGIELDAPYLHVTEFIVDHLDRLQFKNPVERRVVLHAHRGFEQQDKDANFTTAILGAIPGLEVIECTADGDWGRHCSTAQLKSVGEARHGELVDGLFAAAGRHGADAVVAGYHSCYRQLCDKEGEYGIPLIHFSSLVAQSLGIEEFTDTYKALRIAGDAKAAFERLAPVAAGRNVNMKRLEASTAAHFKPSREQS